MDNYLDNWLIILGDLIVEIWNMPNIRWFLRLQNCEDLLFFVFYIFVKWIPFGFGQVVRQNFVFGIYYYFLFVLFIIFVFLDYLFWGIFFLP